MESTEVNCSENSAIQETTTTITTATSTTIVNKITTDKTTTEDHYDIPNNQTEVLTKTTHSDTCNNNDLQSNVNSYENTLTESKVSVDEVENSQDLNKTNTGITIIRDETMNPHIDTFKSEVIPMNTDVSTENTDEVKMKKDKTHMETSEQLQQNSLKNNEDIKTEVELSFTKNSPDISTRNNSSINQSNENYITAHEESVVNNDKDDDKNSPKHPHRPPPPKLSQTKHTSGSLSYSGGENDELTSKNDNSQIDNNNNYETNPKTSLKQQQNDQQKPQYKRPSMKSNIKHVFTNLRKSFKRKDKPSVKRVVSNHDDVENKYTYNSQQPMTTHSYYNNSNNYNDHRNKQSNSLSSSTPHQYYRNSNEIQENQSQLSNEQSLNISITDSLQQLKRPEEDLDIVYSTELIAPPAIPTKMSSDPNNPIYVNHSIKPNRPPNIDRKENDEHDKHVYANSQELQNARKPLSMQFQPHHSYTMRSERRIMSPTSLDRRYPQEYDQYYSSPEARRVQTMRYTDYPTRPRLYQPTYQSATLSFNEYDHHYNNGTLKPRRPKIITERYKCSEVYNWPPKFPKLKRRKTNPPKQIHTAQDHIVIKQQLKTSAENNHSSPVQHTQSNTEQIQCIKVNNQYQSPNGKRELSVSPEPQVTSLHSLQRSTLLEKSNRTSGTETRDQLFIADYKLAPNNQIGSTKPDSLALPYFAKMTENKRFSKFHYNTTTNNNTSNNNNNNIAVSAEVMRSESPKSSTTLKDALKIMHPLFQCLQDKQPTTSSSPTDNHESQNSKLLIDCLSEYLFTCMKLRSLDLQGEFATFVFPLKNFNEQVWNKYGIIDNWNEISIVCAPNTNYEYVVLNTAKESAQKIRFPTKTIDKLLTNWLDNQTTKTPSPENRHSMEKKNNTEKTSDNKLLHSISLAVTLKSLLNLFEKHKEESKAEAESGEQQHQHHHHEQQQCVDLFLTCIKLNVLLSLSECLDKDKSIQLDLIPEHILLILTPSNCLTIFKQYEKDKLPNTDSNHNEVILKETNLQCLLDALHIQSHSMNDSINDVLKQFYEIIQHNYQSKEMIISLLKSIAPPDWITMCVARICLYNQTNS
uniref:DH domain-containing protein n=1 Tax=Schistosoma mansoni TaxID=6183 RepID=A0A3Q0KQZ8_SCHMA